MNSIVKNISNLAEQKKTGLGNLIVISGNEINDLFKNQEDKILRKIEDAYKCHGKGEDDLPHSIFLRFPDSDKNRIIGLPAYLGGDFKMSGMKWIASFPENHEKGLDRASASIILNSTETGIAQAILEGSVISAKRTAAGVALAAKHLVSGEISKASLIGTGLINYESLKFFKFVFPEIKNVLLYDINTENALKFKQKVSNEIDGLVIEIANDLNKSLKYSKLVSIATTAINPYIEDLSECQDGVTVLHTSLRDFKSNPILNSVNIVDDISHVCRANTSVHLAEQDVGNRNFIRCTIADILLGNNKGRQSEDEKIIFSPFGLGILDIALSKLALELAMENNIGQQINSFLPDYWLERV